MQYISEELERIDLLIHLQVLKVRQKKEVVDGFGGLYISDEEVDSVLDKAHPADSDDQHIQALKGLIAEIRADIEEKTTESLRRGIPLSLPLLAYSACLTPFEIDVILICLAPELDAKYERLYAYLQNDATKKQPSVDLIHSLLCNLGEGRIYARQYFHANAPLFENLILRFTEGLQEEEKPLISRIVKLDNRITDYILGFNQVDAKIKPFTQLMLPQTDLEDVKLPEELKNRAYNLIKHWERSGGRTTCLLQGPYGAGKKMIAEGICREAGTPLLIVDIKALMDREPDVSDTVSRIFREAMLQGSALYMVHFERLFSEDAKDNPYKNAMLRALEDYNGIAFIASEEALELDRRLGLQKDLFTIEIPVPDYMVRRQIWESCLGRKFGEYDADGTGALANKFKFTAGQIRDAIVSAERLALPDGRDGITIKDLYEGCRLQSNQKLSALAKRIKPRYKWGDIILPEGKVEQLREVTNYIKNRGVVYHDWGFDNKLSLGKGLNILFSGPSGTGKTMAAEVMASELRLDLYKIDLSMIVSKYIGETEKNLSKIFREAEDSNAILFFDEADALFGKRSEVRDSHDRYANIEISYLLQKMEENEGIVIMASNLCRNIDDAFLRRMHFTVEFPFPEEEYRYRIWKSLFPKEAPLSEDVDFEFLAKRFRLAGGNIKNIVVNAAFLAAENSGAITMEDVIKAARREFQKIGKICSESEFGGYYDLISD